MSSAAAMRLLVPSAWGPLLLRSYFVVWERVSIYLPVLLMGALALGTWWLARNTPIFDTNDGVKIAKHEPDYYLTKFAIRTYDGQGTLKSELAGEQGRHFADTDVLEIDQARMRAFNAQGRLTTATARRALTNGDGSEAQLFGTAQDPALVVREATVDANGKPLPRLEFRGEFLHAFMNTERVKSHKPTTLTRGGDVFSADTMAYDNLSRVADLQGRVRATLTPRQK
jgi:lipopolysaccharide export system protein LptC